MTICSEIVQASNVELNYVNVNSVSVDSVSDAGSPPRQEMPHLAAQCSEARGRSPEDRKARLSPQPAILCPDQAQPQDTEPQPSLPAEEQDDVMTNTCNSPPSVNKTKVKNKILSSYKRLNFEPRVYQNIAKHYKVKAHCSQNISKVSKVASYSTPLLKQKYIFPSKHNECKDENMTLQDDRTMVEVLGDVIGIMTDQYKESEVEFLSRQCGYDASVRMFSKTGQPLPQPLLKDMVKSYKELKGLKSVGKAVQELARTEDKFYYVEKDQVKETMAPASASTVTTADTPLVAREKLVEVSKTFLKFINDHGWILTSARLKRRFRLIKSRISNNKKLTPDLFSFLENYYVLYYDESTKRWVPPECNPEAFPGHVYYIAKGERLKYLPCSLLNAHNVLKKVLFLADSGASHNLIMKSTLEMLNINVFPLKKRRLHLFTASGEEKDTVEGECILELLLEGKQGQKYTCRQPFLVVSDKLNMQRPILGMPFLISQGCQADYEQDAMSARLTNEKGQQVRVMLPAYQENSNNPNVSTINQYSDIYQAPVACFSVSDFSKCTEPDTSLPFNQVSDHCAEDKPGQCGEGDLPSVDAAAKELAAQCHLVYPNTPAHQIFTDLGGQGEEVPLEVREEADEQIFREMDLLCAGDDVREHRDMGKIDSQFTKHCSSRLESLLKDYEPAFASDKRKIGKFKYFQYTPDIKEDSSCKQAIRPQNTMHFKNVQEKIKTLEDNGIIAVSPDQSTRYVHNLLFLSKRKVAEAGRNATKADLHIAGHNHRLTDPDIKVRCINDLSDFNKKCLKATPTIYLPTQMEIQDFVKGKVVSSFDITEMFSSIPLHPDAYKYFNFYLNAKIYCFKVLLQGCSASPFIATEALAQTFGPNVWEALKSKLGNKLTLLFHYYTSYTELVKSFMDDILLASFVLCKCPDGHCDKSFHCPTMQFQETAELHCQCIEALYFAISQAGFLLNPEKSQYFVHSGFVFIGLQFDAVNQSFSIAEDRVKSIMAFRTPRSIPEVHSRVSSLRWSAPFIPYLNKILLPLIQLCAENKGFHWEKRHMEAFNNAKFIVGLCLQKYAFRPDRPHILVSDSSKYSLSYTLYTIDPGGSMQLCETETKICSGAESRLQAVNRELICLLFSIRKCEKYIFAAEESFVALGDFASILYLQMNAPHDSRTGQASIYLSKFTHKLKLCYNQGKHMGLADLFSRQFSNVYLKREDTHLSKTLAQHLPPIPPALRKKLFVMNGEELCDYVFSQLKKTHLDLWDHASHCRQDFRLNDFKSMFREFEPLQGLLRFLKNPFDLKNLDYETLKEYFILLRDSTKTNINQFLKDEKLIYLKDIIQNLDFETNWKKVYGIKPPSPADVSLYSRYPAKGKCPADPGQSEAEEDPVQVSVIMANQSEAVETMCEAHGFVSAVTRSQMQHAPSTECITDPGSSPLSDHRPGCHHYQVATAHSRFPAKAFNNFCSSYKYWLDTAANLHQLLSGLHEDISAPCRKAIMQLQKFNQEPCLVVKFYIFRELFVSIAQSRPSDWICALNPGIQLLAYSVDPRSDYYVQECAGHLLICLKHDLDIDGMEQLELRGNIGFLSDDVVIEQIIQKPLKVYHQSSQLNISLINNVAIFNSSIHQVKLPSQTPLFRVYCAEKKEESLFASIDWKHGQDYFDQIISLMSFNAERHLTSVFSDYLCQSREQLLDSAREAEQDMLTRLSDQPPDSDHPAPEPAVSPSTDCSEDADQGPMTRSRRRRLSQPLCTVHNAEGPVHVFSLSDLSHASGTGSGGQDDEIIDKQTKRRAYHGQHCVSQLLFSHYMRKAAGKIDRPQIIALQKSDDHLLKIRQQLEQYNEEKTEKSSLYILQEGILYKTMHIKEHNATYKALALPQFLVRSILVNLHSRYNIHLDSSNMYLWLRLHLYCFNLMSLIKKARDSCIDCLYSFQAKERAVGGSQLAYRQLEHMGAGSVLYTDLLFLAHDRSANANCLLLVVDSVSKYSQVAICRSKNAKSIINAFQTIFCNIPTPAVIICDAGSEYTSGEVREYLTSLGIELYFTSSKNSQLAEAHIRVLKTYINRFIQAEDLSNNEWSQVLVRALLLLNSRPPNKSCVLSRSQLYFSPLHYQPPWLLNVKTKDNESLNLHKTHLKILQDGRTKYKPKQPYINVHAQRGNIVAHEKPRSSQKSENGSQQLLPSVDKFIKILRVLSDGRVIIGKDLMNGRKVKYNTGQIRPLNIDKDMPFPNRHIKLECLQGLVSPSHGIDNARNLSSLPCPKAFNINEGSSQTPVSQSESQEIVTDQCEAEPGLTDQSEPRPQSAGQCTPAVSWNDQSERTAAAVYKTETKKQTGILKNKCQVIHQPYVGALMSKGPAGKAQYEAYQSASILLSELQEMEPEHCWAYPEWLSNLLAQPAGYGVLYEVLNSGISAPLSASHTRSVCFRKDTILKDFKDRHGNISFVFPYLAHIYCVSQRELSITHLYTVNQLLETDCLTRA